MLYVGDEHEGVCVCCVGVCVCVCIYIYIGLYVCVCTQYLVRSDTLHTPERDYSLVFTRTKCAYIYFNKNEGPFSKRNKINTLN